MTIQWRGHEFDPGERPMGRGRFARALNRVVNWLLPEDSERFDFGDRWH